MIEWNIEVHFGDFPDISDDEEACEALMELLKGSFTYDSALKVICLHWMEEHPDLERAAAEAIKKAQGFLLSIGHSGYPVLKLEISDYERPTETRELSRYADIALYAGCSRQNIAQLARTDPGFPKPVMHLTDGTPLFHPMEAMRYGMSRTEH